MKSDKKSPFTGGKVELLSKEAEVVFRGEKITVEKFYYRCTDTGHEYTDAELDDDFMWAVFRKYCEGKYPTFTDIIENEIEEKAR